MERRFHSPYRHWIAGLLTEVSVLSAFVGFLVALSVVIVWLVR